MVKDKYKVCIFDHEGRVHLVYNPVDHYDISGDFWIRIAVDEKVVFLNRNYVGRISAEKL